MAFFGGDNNLYPMQSRSDCMSLGTISANKDNVRTGTQRFTTGRVGSENLNVSDIQGKKKRSYI
jgi:hypothetical protein